MKGIFITEEGKQWIEAKIAKLNLQIRSERDCESPIEYLLGEFNGKRMAFKEILSSATILPVEESWECIDENTHTIPKIYPQGVIIQPKK
jgi:hypothetical protein